MSRIRIPTVDNSVEASKPLLAAVNKQLGAVPNLMKVLGHSPAALEGYLSLSGALGKGKLGGPLRERLSMAVAQVNGCDYCLSAHNYLGLRLAQLSQNELDSARTGHSEDARAQAALSFALSVANNRGHVSDADLAAVKLAGFDEAAVLEIVVEVALNTLTNYVNSVAQTDIDFPVLQSKLAA